MPSLFNTPILNQMELLPTHVSSPFKGMNALSFCLVKYTKHEDHNDKSPRPDLLHEFGLSISQLYRSLFERGVFYPVE